MRSHFITLAGWLWVAVALVWLPGYFTRKPTLAVPHKPLQVAATGLLAIGFPLVFVSGRLLLARHGPLPAATVGAIGLVLTLIGIAVAIWARVMLGRNWTGTVAAVQEDHALVQSGPYAVIRHPIYTGLLLALLGTALTIGRPLSYAGVALALIALLIRVEIEDRLMQQQFGAAHEGYRRRTKKLVPFVW